MAKQQLWIVFTATSYFKASIQVIFAIFMLAIAPIAGAIVVTLEPDDFGLDKPLQNEYVLAAYLDDPANSESWSNVLTAKDRSGYDPEYAAPTGRLIFGAFPFIAYGGASSPSANYGGLGFLFNQDVRRVTLLANSLYPPGDLAAVWMAFDVNGNQISAGSAGGDRPANETFEIDIQVAGIRSLVLGGDASTAAICFDNLVFEFDEAAVIVPEPGSIILFIIGLIIVCVHLRHAKQL